MEFGALRMILQKWDVEKTSFVLSDDALAMLANDGIGASAANALLEAFIDAAAFESAHPDADTGSEMGLSGGWWVGRWADGWVGLQGGVCGCAG